MNYGIQVCWFDDPRQTTPACVNFGSRERCPGYMLIHLEPGFDPHDAQLDDLPNRRQPGISRFVGTSPFRSTNHQWPTRSRLSLVSVEMSIILSDEAARHLSLR